MAPRYIEEARISADLRIARIQAAIEVYKRGNFDHPTTEQPFIQACELLKLEIASGADKILGIPLPEDEPACQT